MIPFTPHLPPEAMGAATITLFILGIAALVDLFTKRVPDLLVLGGCAALAALQFSLLPWRVAAFYAQEAAASALIIWGVNAIWYKKFGSDALGMGDGKWTALATLAFGALPALLAWGFGAIFASLFLGALRLAGQPAPHLAFAPFLFVGLCVALSLSAS